MDKWTNQIFSRSEMPLEYEFVNFPARLFVKNCLQQNLDDAFENFLIPVTLTWAAKSECL